MTQLFTPEDVILHLYGEISAEERQLLDQALREDYLLREDNPSLQRPRAEIPRLHFNASKASLKAILEYSKTGCH